MEDFKHLLLKNTKSLCREGKSMLLNDIRHRDLEGIRSKERDLLREATNSDSAIFLEEKNGDKKCLAYETKLIIDLTGEREPLGKKSLSRRNNEPPLVIRRVSQITVPGEITDKLLQRLPELYRMAMVAVLVNKEYMYVRKEARHKVREGCFSYPDLYIDPRKNALWDYINGMMRKENT